MYTIRQVKTGIKLRFELLQTHTHGWYNPLQITLPLLQKKGSSYGPHIPWFYAPTCP